MKQNYSMSGYGLRNRLRNHYHLFTLIVLFIFGGLHTAQSQKMEKLPGPIIVCPAKFKNENMRMGMSQLASKKSLTSGKSNVTADISIVFGPGAQGNAEVQAAFQFAADIWAQEIVSSVPIVVSADFADLGPGVLASAGPTQIFSDFENAPVPGIFYPTALANALAGEPLDPTEPFDLVVNIGNGIPWYFGTDGNPPPGQFDFVTVALHEMGHGLGFFDGGNVDANGVGSVGFAGGIPVIFDTFHQNSAGVSPLDLPNPSVELGDFYTSGDVFANGAFAVAALGGTLPELFAPNPFQGGSSIAHWDEATFPAGDINSLMSPQVGAAESNFDIGPITRGYFRDMGWVLATAAPIAVNPTSISEEMNIEETLAVELSVTNLTEESVVVTATASADAVVIGMIDPESITLESLASGTVEVTLNTVGVPAGIYEEEIVFSVEGEERTVSVPITVRVLDGTEAPIIEVSPESFDETLEQLLVVTRDLTIANTGNDDLSFSISVSDGNDMPQATFADRVALSNESIRTNGFTSKSFPTSASKSLSSMITAGGISFNAMVTSLLATDFEDFVLGEFNGQNGWSSQPANFFSVSDANAFEGTQHVRGTSDGSGALALAFSPLITPGDEPFMVATAQLNVVNNGSSFEFIPQSPAAGSVVTRVRFNADGSIDVLDGSVSAFVPIETTTPEGYFELRVVVDRDDFALSVFIDNELVHSGTGFAGVMEQIVLLSDNITAGSAFDMDNLEVTDGDENAFFLTVSPISGEVPFGSSTVAEVKFDTRSLDPGVYNATITVTSNDTDNPSIDIPVTLTVIAPPTITVAPDALSAAVNVQTDDPPVATDSFTITNSGDSPLEYTTSLGATVFTPPSSGGDQSVIALDMSKYGVGTTSTATEKLAGKSLKRLKVINSEILLENATFNDSIFYDTGISFPDNFAGVDTDPYSSAVNFDVEADFTLTAVRNGYRTETLASPVYILEIVRGGATPNDGELLLSKTFEQASEEGVVVVEELGEAFEFSAGESFWVVHKYPLGISFPQGTDDNATQRPDTYFFSGDGGTTYNPSGFVFFVRALSGSSDEPYITLEPSSGSVAPGETVEVSVSFDGSELANGTFNTDILVNSNDPVTPTVPVATTFEVSGQISGIEVSEELLTFNDVFVGNSRERTFTITNTGLAQLNVSSITSDNDDFSPGVSATTIDAGEEAEITVTFTPSSVGSINGILTITSDADNASSIDVVLNGIGVDPPMAFLDPQEVFETTNTGTTVDTEIVLRNDGNSPLTFSFPDFAVAAAMVSPDLQLNNTELIDFGVATPVKGVKDLRQGHPVEFSVGTDISFGYTWIDSDEEGGPVYFPFDITGSGLDLSEAVGADGTVEVGIPFPIEFYGITYESVFISANGFVSFQAPTTPFTFFNEQIPVDDGVNNVVAGFWSDLEPQNGGSVHIAAFADAIVIQWTNAPIFFGAADETVTFKVILLADGNIEIFYDDVDGASFTDEGTVGIENADGSDGAQVAFNTPYIRDGLALRFVQPEIGFSNLITNVSPMSGVVPAGGSRTLTVTLDATELEPGTYLDDLTVSSNAPDKSGSTSLIELTVLDVPTVVNFTLVDAVADVEIGPLGEGDVIDLANFDANKFSVVANIGDIEVGSVVFDFNGDEGFQTENVAPYALNGDNNGNFRSLALPMGPNTITATPFSGPRGTGDAGIALTVNFEVVDTSVVEISNFMLIDADTDTEIGPIADGDVIDLANFDANSFNISAVPSEEVGSVVFDFNGTTGFQTENVAPYALGGDRRGNFNSLAFPLGINTVTATAFLGSNGSGQEGLPSTISFEVVDSGTTAAAVFGEGETESRVYPNPVQTLAHFSLEGTENESQVLKGTLVNLLGQVVMPSFDMAIDDLGSGSVDMSTLPQGTYVLRLTDKTGKVVSQVKLLKR
ncbi:MAG: choice-of-anchor D domain-containing protein [Bacteroidota bacterium]